MKKIMILILLIVAVAFVASAFAATSTSPLAVTATVNAGCTLQSTSAIAFGAYDPTSATPRDASGNMVIRCVKGTAYKTYIAGARTMTGGASTLHYEIYQEAGHTTVYPSVSASGLSGTSLNLTPVTINLYGRVPAGQDVGVASYTGSVTATIEY